MYRTVFSLIPALVLAPTLGLAAMQQQASHILSSEIAISRDRAEIKLELDDGRKLTLATTTGRAAGTAAAAPGAAPMQQTVTPSGDQMMTLHVERGDAMDRSWRELLNKSMDVSGDALAVMLQDWHAPNRLGEQFDHALEAALAGDALPVAAAPVAPGMNDSVVKLESRIQQLEEQLDEARDRAIAASSRHRGPDWLAPLRHVWRGLSGILSTLVTFAVLFGLAVAGILLGARKYIEGVADTVRAGTGRAFLVGLAGSFLLVPVFVLGVIALAISIVGIPALLVWVPLFPIGAVVAVLLGFISVAHAIGENWAERQYSGAEWYNRANSYYFIAAGLALLSSLFIAANVITMAGPWLGFINNILNFIGACLIWGAATVGFGAVLISRGGSRSSANGVDASPFTEGAGV